MEPEQRGRTSRASSTSSLGREVRCGCQYYQSDSLLPERRALLVRPSSRTMQQPPAVRCSEHDYEPIAPPSSSLPHPATAPVVRITDTDVMPVADSDDSLDDRGRLPPELILDGGVILPLDGKIEYTAMEGRELGETGGDTSAEELEPTAQQFQDRLEERFLAPTPYTESRTDGEVNTSQVDSSAMEERGVRGLPQRLKTQAGKLRSRLRGFQRPTLSFSQKRQKPEKTTTTTTTITTTTVRSATASSGKSDKSRKSVEKRPSRIDRIRTSISEKTGKFNLPDRPKFSLPDRSKFHLPERPKFSFPDKSRFHLPDKSKFTIKKPNIRLPGAFTRVKRSPLREQQQQQHSTESTAGSKRNIFDFATYPRIFDKKSKKRGEYATSSPKDSRAQSAESATFPRSRKGKSFSARWAQRFGDSAYVQDQDHAEEAAGSDGSPPWHQSSMEEPPRLSARTEEEILAAAHAIPWEDTRKREQYDEEEIQYMDYEQESSEMSDRHPAPPKRSYRSRRQDKSYEHEQVMEVDPKLYDDQRIKHVHQDDIDENEDAAMQDNWHADQQMMHKEKFRPIPRSRSLDEDMPRVLEQDRYDGAFMAVDPRLFVLRKMASDEEEGEEEHEPSSLQSDREQQASSGSSCDRRRRGVIEEIDSDEFFLRASGISQDDMNLGNYLTDEIRDALRAEVINALQDDELPPTPPQRPMRTLRKHKAGLVESDEAVPPVRPKRERSATSRQSREASIEMFRERTRSDSRSDSRHRVVYQAEGDQPEPSQEPLDDIVVVKPVRRKSRSSLRSHSQPPMETSILSSSTPVTVVPDSSTVLSSMPPVVPVRRKRSHREMVMDRRNGDVGAPICNGHRDVWEIEIIESRKPVIPAKSSRSRQSLEQFTNGDIVMSASHEDIENLDMRFRQEDAAPEPVPIPPKRRSRSRTISAAADEDRTSHGAESLPEAGYIEEDIPQEEENGSAQDIPGYAIVEKREKPPRPPPPRRKRNKFATTPRPTPPKRPHRAYSTLGPTRTRDISMTSEPIISMILASSESMPYIEVDEEEIEHRDFRSGELLNKIQGRPLPAPPRPPRAKKEPMMGRPRTPFEYAETTEATTATQTDPLPDDMVIEEITQAKLIMTPSRSGSQIMVVSMEHIPSPSRTTTPTVPPLPMPHFLRKEGEQMEEEEEEERLPGEEDIQIAYDTMSLTSPSPTREIDLKDMHRSAPHLEERVMEESQTRPQVKLGLLPDEPLRISSLEVGDLKVDRLSVSQIEAHKIVASEVDAMMITASELRGGDSMEESFSPAIIRELMAIRSHLETVMTTQTQERYRESEKQSTSHKITDIPTTDNSRVQERQPASQDVPSEQQSVSQDVPLERQPVSQDVPSERQPVSQDVPSERQPVSQDVPSERQPVSQDVPSEQQFISQDVSSEQQSVSQNVPSEATKPNETVVNEPASTEDEKTETGEDQKVVKTNVVDVRDKEISPPLSVAQTKEFPSPQTLTIDELESKDKDESTINLLTVAQDKSLQILDSEHLLTLSSQITSGSHVDESRASYPPSDAPSIQPSELRESPERVGEPPSISVQTTTATITTTTTTTTATSTTTSTATIELGATSTNLRGSKDDVSDSKEHTPRISRSRSPSPSKGIMRQTASPVRSLPPAISVTPDTPDSTVPRHGSISTDAKPQRAVISYSSNAKHDVAKDSQPQRAVISQSSDTEQSLTEKQRESSQSPVSSFPLRSTHFIAFPASEIPAQFFSLSEMPTSQRSDTEPGVIDTTRQLLRALRLAGINAMRYFIGYLTSTLSMDNTREKIREVELAICALLLLIAGLLIYYFSSTRIVTHHHHWDYFNPPK